MQGDIFLIKNKNTNIKKKDVRLVGTVYQESFICNVPPVPLSLLVFFFEVLMLERMCVCVEGRPFGAPSHSMGL